MAEKQSAMEIPKDESIGSKSIWDPFFNEFVLLQE
jgi:hypothetical protein